MNVNVKYLKDENGDIISPVTNEKCVFDDNGKTPSQKYSLLTHTHSYLPLSGGTMTGNIATKNLYPTSNGGSSLGTNTYGYSKVRLYNGCSGEITMYYGSHMALLAPTRSKGIKCNQWFSNPI